MALRVDARDVLDPEARTCKLFSGRVQGYFRSTGANPWDDYTYVREDGGPIEVLPGLEVQLEPRGAMVRLRSGGRVVRVSWEPSDEELAAIGSDSPGALRAFFTRNYLEPFREMAGHGATAVIARKLQE